MNANTTQTNQFRMGDKVEMPFSMSAGDRDITVWREATVIRANGVKLTLLHGTEAYERFFTDVRPLPKLPEVEQDRRIEVSDVQCNLYAIPLAIEYLNGLGDTPITGEQVAKFFEAVLIKGRFWTDATDDAGLPEFPDHLL